MIKSKIKKKKCKKKLESIQVNLTTRDQGY